MKKTWTREKVIEGLKLAASQIEGDLPCHDRIYSQLKKGHMDWPPAVRILEYFHAMSRGWIAAGLPQHRISFHNIDWTPRELEFLLDNAGLLVLSDIAKRLRRTQPAIRRRLYQIGITARANQGMLSASDLAKKYNCSYERVRNL